MKNIYEINMRDGVKFYAIAESIEEAMAIAVVETKNISSVSVLAYGTERACVFRPI